LAEYDLGTGGQRMIDGGYVADIMRKDWGFYYTTRANLQKLTESLSDRPALPEDVAASVRSRLGQLDDAIERAPKTQRWKLRARVKWYEDVEDVNREQGPGRVTEEPGRRPAGVPGGRPPGLTGPRPGDGGTGP